jgi:ABC-type multidrug transport system fused ATPase/permease subunit
MLLPNSVLRSWKLLSVNEKRIVKFISFIQVIMNFLDLLGIGLIATLAALSIQNLTFGGMGNRVEKVILLLNLDTLTFPQQIAFLGSITCLIFVCKTFISAFLVRYLFYFFSRKATVISSNMIAKIVNRNFEKQSSKTSQEILYAATTGVNTLMTGLLATSINIFSDVTLFLILVIGLFIIDPKVSILLVAIFVLIAFILYKLTNKRAESLGRQSSDLSISNNHKILEILYSQKEIFVRGREDFYIDRLVNIRSKLGNVNAEIAFQPLISKYVIELASVVGILVLAITQFVFNDAVYGIAILSTFIAAISRITPSLLRIQQGFVSLKANSGIVEDTLELIYEIEPIKVKKIKAVSSNSDYLNFVPSVKIENVSYSYSDISRFKLESINLKILPGEIVAFVGPSGAGKTTLVELILGLIKPDLGHIEISGISPEDAISKWPGSISYVPQNVYITPGTVKENIGLGFEIELANEDLVWKCIKLAQLNDVVSKFPFGIDTELGEHGTKISGGERQRIGIARALFTSPKILVLDESTSSLDSQTEKKLSDSIINLRTKTTVLIIAHRLSTVKVADKVVYLDNGRILSVGTFDQVKNNVPDFTKQASLMGL